MSARSPWFVPVLAALVACGGSGPAVSSAAALGPPAPRAGPGWTELQVGGQTARIFRDDLGTPHVFAPTNHALFVAYGYAVAQDRLFQLELNRRAARGTLAELFGPAYVDADRYQRTVGYTDDELDGIFAALPADERAIYDAYAEGVNRYVDDVVSKDPRKVPLEFALLGALPAPWTTRDSMAFGAFMVRRFGEIGGSELANAALLGALVAAHGATEGMAIFDDVRWLDDPDAPVTVPSPADGKRAPSQALSAAATARLAAALPAASATATAAPDDGLATAKALWASLGVPTKLGSYAWLVSPGRSAEGVALLYGGPQMGASAPEVLHQVQLTGGDGFQTVGMAFAGAPAILIGRNGHVAWTSTTATGDNVDVYAETLCDAGAGPGSGYQFRGACRAYDVRVESIAVRGASPVALTVARSVHGPVVATADNLAFTEKRAHWLRELETGSAFFGFDRATNLERFERAVGLVVTSHNFLYADRLGNIAYWQAGQVPLRPAGFDPRLPLPGDGSAEWPGGLVPTPRSVNPPQGWLANWNNKPSLGYPAADDQNFGKQGRLREIVARLATNDHVTVDDMRDIPKDIARVKGNGRDSRFLRPYLLAALDAVPPAHPVAPAARAVVASWDQNAFPDAVSSTTIAPGELIFTAWLNRALADVFADELGTSVGDASPNMLLHVLDFAATLESGVPPSRDYLNGQPWQAVLSAAFDEAVAALATAGGTDPTTWTAPRPETVYTHPVVGEVARIPQSNRATYAQIVALGRPEIAAESIFSLGQSGFIAVAPSSPAGFELDPHFLDQLPLYRAFEYAPQVLYRPPGD
ncbi:penicillin acylase family protein [Anaeromyxobacter oryzae]|uniref:Penicillin amidase n=1 Tax=Anaeromyxobacter oryzae TaxID=2918170 RepID=A0ABN6MVN5_9BACT|nr:penicillin acylase family protein [Anaeromyxobacter oryzae]BDG04971.1 penicillin amidase [Anaeromyxobacter oryzae]